jgi:hypothetical protein
VIARKDVVRALVKANIEFDEGQLLCFFKEITKLAAHLEEDAFNDGWETGKKEDMRTVYENR